MKRENELKKRICDKYTLEEDNLKLVNNSLNEKLSSIIYLKNEKENIDSFCGFDFLMRLKNYSSHIDSFDTNIPSYNKDITLFEIKKEEEIENLKNILSDLLSEKEQDILLPSKSNKIKIIPTKEDIKSTIKKERRKISTKFVKEIKSLTKASKSNFL